MSLAPSVTEILCAVGVGDRLVGVDKWSDYPPEVRSLPRVGGIVADADAVLELRPDLIVGCTSVPGMERNAARLADSGIALTVAEPTDLEGTLRSILAIGLAVGRGREAAALVSEMERRIDSVRALAADLARPSVYWEWWPKPLSAAAGRSWMNGLIEIAGGHNIFADVDLPSLRPDPAAVIALDPEVICLAWCGASKAPDVEQVRARPGWSLIRAVADRRVHALPEGMFARPGPRLVDGLEQVARILRASRPVAS